MHALPVLMLTQDAPLWQHWQQIASAQWLPARGTGLADVERWKQKNRSLVVVDAALPHVPDWSDACWPRMAGDMKLLVLSARPSDEVARKALAAGCSGYAHAYSTPTTLTNILHSIATGNIWMGRSLLQRLLQDVDARLPEPGTQWADQLSRREQEVARFAAMGQSNAEIAERLAISERTVRAHLSAIFEKLQVQDRLMLALKVHGINNGQAA